MLKYILWLWIACVAAQPITRKDSLQGGLRPERTCFDVQHYHLWIKVDVDNKHITGYNTIGFVMNGKARTLQLDLFDNMKVDSIVYQNKPLEYKRDCHAVFINFQDTLAEGSEHEIQFYYSGHPLLAKNAPWDGGFVFSQDTEGKPWVGVAVQGTGASLWYPVKDTQTDEPDKGAVIEVAVPNGLMNVSNGNLIGSKRLDDQYTLWSWEVTNPINNYNITLNIGNYEHFSENINGLKANYYVLKANKAKAKEHFKDVKTMFACFQSKFGDYPFANDGYKLVETPYLGMEHQSAVAYGNKYTNGYLGDDLSGTGEGLFFDFIIIHETAHEWFGNSITALDIADMWIHEGFTTYAESVYIECVKGYDIAQKYINGQAKNIFNRKPVRGIFGVNREGSSDMYNKGALLINTLRHMLNNDEKWWQVLYKFTTTFQHKLVDTPVVIDFFEKETLFNLKPIFNQYLNYPKLPELELHVAPQKLYYRWNANDVDFKMPVDIKIKEKNMRITPKTTWLSVSIPTLDTKQDIEVATNKFYISVKKQ